jgi:hypothetical protein
MPCPPGDSWDARLGKVETEAAGVKQIAKELARQEKTTLKELTEEGLQLVLSLRGRGSARKLNPVVFQGQRLSPAFGGKPWAEIRGEIYRGYGS